MSFIVNTNSTYPTIILRDGAIIMDPASEKNGDMVITNKEKLTHEEYTKFFVETLGSDIEQYMHNYTSRRLISMQIRPQLWAWLNFEDSFGIKSPMKSGAFEKYATITPKLLMKFPGFRVPSERFVGEEEEIEDTLINVEFQMNHLLVGPTGCGKTFGAEEILLRLGIPVITKACNLDTDHASLFGQTGINNGDTYFKQGMAALAIKWHAGIILDEVTAIDPTRGLDMNPLLERRDIVIDGHGDMGDMILSNNGMSHIMGTSNTGGKRSGNRAYKNAHVQDLAFRDRWNVSTRSYKGKEFEIENITRIFSQWNLKSKTFTVDQKAAIDVVIDSVANFTINIRDAFVAERISVPVSNRGLENFVKYFSATGNVYLSYVKGFLEKAEDDDRTIYDAEFIAAFGKELFEGAVQSAA